VVEDAAGDLYGVGEPGVIARCIENEILMQLRSLKKTRKDVSPHDPIGTDKEGYEITLIDILGTEDDDVVDKVQLVDPDKVLGSCQKRLCGPCCLQLQGYGYWRSTRLMFLNSVKGMEYRQKRLLPMCRCPQKGARDAIKSDFCSRVA
jgi:hypothetical protein